MRLRPLDSPRAIAAVILLFGYNGLVVGVYSSSIAILRDKIGLNPTRLAILFVITGVAAVCAMQVSGRLADKYGARRLCLALILPLIIAATGFALVPTYALLLVTGVFLGMGNGGIDVAMNALAVQVERHRLDQGKGAIMSFFHGTWSAGGFLGALAISLVGTAIKLPPAQTLMVCALAIAGLGVVAWFVAFAITPETEVITHVAASGEKTPIPRVAYLMGLMAVAFGLGEGTASDWSGPHVQTVAAVDPRTAAWAVTAITACMVIIRLSGDLLVSRVGRRNIVRGGGAVAATGYLIAAFGSGFPLLLLGWGLVGLGIGVVAPQVYAAAGHLAGGRGLAMVVTFGYTVFLVGPAAMGALIHTLGIQHAMIVPGVLLLGLIPLAGVAMKDDRGAPSSPSAADETAEVVGAEAAVEGLV
ncbi:MAG: MFS transporter [Propionibacteriaceae bacterium]|jgi:MFS family permease|nr:MFS transporter [Propionibacteriaceae bacterium]